MRQFSDEVCAVQLRRTLSSHILFLALLFIILMGGPGAILAQDAASPTTDNQAPTLLQPSFGPSRATTKVVTHRSLARPSDPVTLSASKMGAFLESPIESIRAYACPDDRLVPIPFQIDKRDNKGRYLLPDGKDADRPPLLSRSGSLFTFRRRIPQIEEHDELVFLASDVGNRVTSTRWLEGATSGIEISITDPVTKEQGWVYLFQFEVPPSSSRRNDVAYTYFKGTDEIQARSYSIRYGSGPGTLLLPDIDPPVNVLVARFSSVFGLVSNARNAGAIHAEVAAYRDGPVRVIRRVNANADFMLWINTPTITLETFYYPDLVIAPQITGHILSNGTYLNDVTLETSESPENQINKPGIVTMANMKFALIPKNGSRNLYAIPDYKTDQSKLNETADMESTVRPPTTELYEKWVSNPLTASTKAIPLPSAP